MHPRTVSGKDHTGRADRRRTRRIWHSVRGRLFIWCKSPASEVAVRDPLAEPSDLIRSVSRALRVLESVGRAPKGLTVKQIARRCELTVATTYHLVRTLAYEGYVIRREDGTYIVGLEVADRYRELVTAFRGPPAVGESLRRAGGDTGWSPHLGGFGGGRGPTPAGATTWGVSWAARWRSRRSPRGRGRRTWRTWCRASTRGRTPP